MLTMNTDFLLNQIKSGAKLSLKDQIVLIVKLSIPAIFAQISAILMEYIEKNFHKIKNINLKYYDDLETGIHIYVEPGLNEAGIVLTGTEIKSICADTLMTW